MLAPPRRTSARRTAAPARPVWQGLIDTPAHQQRSAHFDLESVGSGVFFDERHSHVSTTSIRYGVQEARLDEPVVSSLRPAGATCTAPKPNSPRAPMSIRAAPSAELGLNLGQLNLGLPPPTSEPDGPAWSAPPNTPLMTPHETPQSSHACLHAPCSQPLARAAHSQPRPASQQSQPRPQSRPQSRSKLQRGARVLSTAGCFGQSDTAPRTTWDAWDTRERQLAAPRSPSAFVPPAPILGITITDASAPASHRSCRERVVPSSLATRVGRGPLTCPGSVEASHRRAEASALADELGASVPTAGADEPFLLAWSRSKRWRDTDRTSE